MNARFISISIHIRSLCTVIIQFNKIHIISTLQMDNLHMYGYALQQQQQQQQDCSAYFVNVSIKIVSFPLNSCSKHSIVIHSFATIKFMIFKHFYSLSSKFP